MSLGGSDTRGNGDPEQTVVIARTASGWRVEQSRTGAVGDESGDLVEALVLADLLAEDVPTPNRPARSVEPPDELSRLRAAVGQLEHALASRVTIEQSVGVLAERHRLTSREAFERLRRAARSRGRRVRDLAGDVVASTGGPVDGLPPELASAPIDSRPLASTPAPVDRASSELGRGARADSRQPHPPASGPPLPSPPPRPAPATNRRARAVPAPAATADSGPLLRGRLITGH